MPTENLPLKHTVRIYFNQYQVPFIEAQDDGDLAFALGMVHAHLRLGQMEMMRHAAQGRLAEMFGPFVSKVDQSLRIIDFAKAAEGMMAITPPETRAWVERFVQGINAYQARSSWLTPELAMLGVEPTPWTLQDLAAVGRLAATDINWLFWQQALARLKQPAWPKVWDRILAHGRASLPSYGPDEPVPLDILAGSVKSGSNSLAVSGRKTQSGAALMANDTHVGLTVPPLWILVGMKSPSYHQVGLAIAGLPVVVVGRNPDIAWGGTNMISLSSSLYDISDSKFDKLKQKTERIQVRWWFDREVTVRESELGPVITDSPYLAEYGLPRLALKWRGHMPSDETTAFLKVNRARTWEEFRQAFATYAVSGQNMLYADKAGNIGQVMALEFDPAAGRTGERLIGDPEDPDQRWGRAYKSTQLPAGHNPEAGYLVSTNNTPVKSEPPVSLFRNSNDRYSRLSGILAGRQVITPALLREMQTDVYAESSLRLARAIAETAGEEPAGAKTLLTALKEWDGKYEVDSQGAAALELSAYHLTLALYTPVYGEELAQYMLGRTGIYDYLSQDLEAGGKQAALDEALAKAATDFGEYPTWGSLHYLQLQHFLGNAPVIGSRFRYQKFPYPGSSNTVLKSAHSVGNEPGPARYGANARHISDLSDPDENYFVLLGGEDGFMGSDNFLDQVELWRKGEYLRMPLTMEAVKREFPHCLELKPAKP